MHAIEYFSAVLVVVPIPAKEAAHHVLRKFQVGDFVYIRRPNVRNTLQMAAQGMILRIKAIKDTEVVVLQGRCGCTVTNHARNLSPCHLPKMDGTIRLDLAVPHLTWPAASATSRQRYLHCSCATPVAHRFTHTVSAPHYQLSQPVTGSALTVLPTALQLSLWIAPTAPERAPKEPNLFPTPQTRSRDLAAKACDQMVVIKHIKFRGSLDKEVWGIATYLGALARPWYLHITYDDGQVVPSDYSWPPTSLDAATPLTCLLSAAQAQSPHRTDLPSKPFQVTQRLFHHIRRLANLIWAYDNTQVNTLTVWRVIRFQSALVDAHATALTLHPAMFLTARHPAAPVSDLRLYTDDISVPFDALDLALLRLPFPGSFTPLLNFPFFRQHILAMLHQDGFGPDRVTPGTPQRTAAQDIQGVFGDTAHLGN
eukprot:gene5329-biopygen8831